MPVSNKSSLNRTQWRTTSNQTAVINYHKPPRVLWWIDQTRTSLRNAPWTTSVSSSGTAEFLKWALEQNINMNSGQTHTSPSQTLLLLFSFRVKHRTCNADDGPLCRVQHVSGGWLGALHAMVFGQVPGQRVSRWRRVSHRAQVAGALLRRRPDQRPPLGLVLHLLHGLDES